MLHLLPNFFFTFKFITTYITRSYAPEYVQMYINVNSKSLARTEKNTWKKRCNTGPIYLSKTKHNPISRQPKIKLSQLNYGTLKALISRDTFLKFQLQCTSKLYPFNTNKLHGMNIFKQQNLFPWLMYLIVLLLKHQSISISLCPQATILVV